MEAWRWDLARERSEALFRPSECAKCPQWQGQPHTALTWNRPVPQGSREPGTAPGLSWRRTGGALFPALSCPASQIHLPRNLSYKRLQAVFSPFQGWVYSWPLKAAQFPRPGAHVPGSSELWVGCIFRLTSRQRADRPGNGYRPRAAGEQLIQSWKGALVVKPFNGPSPMIISPGLELANSEPL